MKFTGIITVYNSSEVDFKKTLLPHLLNGVYIEKTHSAESNAEGDKNMDNLLVIIPFKPHKKGVLTPVEFEKCEEKSEHWTLAAGDIIAVGDVGSANNFAELTARAETFRIVSVKTFDFGDLPHWEVICK